MQNRGGLASPTASCCPAEGAWGGGSGLVGSSNTNLARPHKQLLSFFPHKILIFLIIRTI